MVLRERRGGLMRWMYLVLMLSACGNSTVTPEVVVTQDVAEARGNDLNREGVEDVRECAAFDYTPIDFGFVQPVYGVGTAEVVRVLGGDCEMRYIALTIQPKEPKPYQILAFYDQPIVLAPTLGMLSQVTFSVVYTGEPRTEDYVVRDTVTVGFTQIDAQNRPTGVVYEETFDVSATFTWRDPPVAKLAAFRDAAHAQPFDIGLTGAASEVPLGVTLYFSGQGSGVAAGREIEYLWSSYWFSDPLNGSVAEAIVPDADGSGAALHFDQCGSYGVALQVSDGELTSPEWMSLLQFIVNCEQTTVPEGPPPIPPSG